MSSMLSIPEIRSRRGSEMKSPFLKTQIDDIEEIASIKKKINETIKNSNKTQTETFYNLMDRS